jgi:hypothetical protein
MLNEKPSKIAVYLRQSLEKWTQGDFLPDNRPYLLNVPTKRPPVNLSSSELLPDLTVEDGQRLTVAISPKVLNRMDFEGKVISKAGLIDDKPLPKWLHYNEETRILTGAAMPGDKGDYEVKIYFSDEKANVAYVTFKIKVVEVFVPGMSVPGQTKKTTATVLKRCVGTQCKDDYITDEFMGSNVKTSPNK